MFIDDPQRFLILELKEKVATVLEKVERKFDILLLNSINHAIDTLMLNKDNELEYKIRKDKFRATLQELSLEAEACVNVQIRRSIIPIVTNLIEWTDDTL